MRSLLLLLPLLMLFTGPASADIQVIPIENPTYPQSISFGTVDIGSIPEIIGGAAGPTRVLENTSKVGITLNCENDNTPTVESTLELDQNSLFGGTIFAAPGSPNPYLVTGVTLGVFDQGQIFPATLDVLVYEGAPGGGGPFVSVAAFQVVLDGPFGIPPVAAIIDVEIASLNIVASNDLMVLYGDTNPSLGSDIVPAGDNSPRCLLDFDSVCSVVIDLTTGNFSAYGISTPECESSFNERKLFDLVMEVTVSDGAVATEKSTWGGVKVRWR